MSAGLNDKPRKIEAILKAVNGDMSALRTYPDIMVISLTEEGFYKEYTAAKIYTEEEIMDIEKYSPSTTLIVLKKPILK